MSNSLKVVLSIVTFLVIIFLTAGMVEMIVGVPMPGVALFLALPFAAFALYAIWKPHPDDAQLDASGEGIGGVLEALTVAVTDGWTFEGRIPRATYWWFLLVFWVCMLLMSFLPWYLALLPTVGFLVLCFPYLSITVRRLHDIDRSGQWVWLHIAGPFGGIILLFMCSAKGTFGPNRFGIDPLRPDMSEEVAADVQAYRERRRAEIAAERGW